MATWTGPCGPREATWADASEALGAWERGARPLGEYAVTFDAAEAAEVRAAEAEMEAGQ